jgi:hypothetical protein
MRVKSILSGGKRVPLDTISPKALRRLTALPWCSRVNLHSDDKTIGIISCPAQLAASWHLPVIGPEFSSETDTVETLKAEANRLRKSGGYAAVS